MTDNHDLTTPNPTLDKINISDKMSDNMSDNGLFDDVWDLNVNTKGIVTTNKSDIREWDDILNVYEPTRILEKHVIVNIVKPIVPVVKSQSKPSTKKNAKQVISITSNKKTVSKQHYDSEDDDGEYDDTYDDYY